MSTTYELTLREVGYSSRSKYDHTSKKSWFLASHVMMDALELPTHMGHLAALARMSGWVVGVGRAHCAVVALTAARACDPRLSATLTMPLAADPPFPGRFQTSRASPPAAWRPSDPYSPTRDLCGMRLS